MGPDVKAMWAIYVDNAFFKKLMLQDHPALKIDYSPSHNVAFRLLFRKVRSKWSPI